jgi:EAL domain-containing protein (putative c-di-GMP-specific phosphodiesterase class I)
MAAAVAHLARVLGMHVVAEGVETREQAERLLALGYAAAQGYWFAEPGPQRRSPACWPAGSRTGACAGPLESHSVANPEPDGPQSS